MSTVVNSPTPRRGTPFPVPWQLPDTPHSRGHYDIVVWPVLISKIVKFRRKSAK